MPQCKECSRTGFQLDEMEHVDGKGLICSECAERISSEDEDKVVQLREGQPVQRAQKPMLDVSADEKGVDLSLSYDFLAVSVRFEWAGLMRAAKKNLQKTVFGD